MVYKQNLWQKLRKYLVGTQGGISVELEQLPFFLTFTTSLYCAASKKEDLREISPFVAGSNPVLGTTRRIHGILLSFPE